MGVRGLYYYIAKVLGLKTVPHGEPLDLASVASSSRGWSRPLSDSDQAGVVFDGESLCYWATEVPWEVGNRVDSVHGGESLHMFMTFLKFFERFATEQIPICVIFDGVKLAAKKKTLLRRRRSSVVGNKAVNKSTKAALTSEMFDRSLFARSVMIEALRVISNRYPGYVLVRCALAEGDSDCVRFARELRAYAVIGNDFDFVILMAQAPEVKFISIFAIIFSGTSHRSYPEWKYQKGLSWIEFSPENCALLHSAFQEWRVGGAGKQRRVRFSQLGSGLADVVTFERSDINGRELQVRFLTYVDNKPEVFVVKRPMINCRYYDAEMIASALGVDSTSLPILATCIGSDFLPQDDLKRFHQDIGVLQQAGGWLKRSDIVPTVAAMVRQSLGESSMNSLRSEVCRMLSSSDFGIDASKVNATLDFFTLQPLREEKVIQIFLRILRLWYPLRDGYLEPNVLKILSSGGRLRCPPTMEIGRFKNIFHSNMNENMLPLMNLFVTLFDECASIVVSYYQRYMPGSIENAVVSELKLAGDRILEVVQNAGANTGCIDQVLQIVEGCDSDWSAAHAMPRDFVNEVVATGSMRHLRLPSVGSVRELIINSLALCQPTPITFPGEVVQFLLSPELRDSQFLDLCSFFSIIDMGYPKLYNQVENCFEIMKESYILSFLARNRRSLAIGTENELSEIKKTCVRLKPFHDIDSDCKNCIQSFMSALSYGHMLINQVAVIILNVLGDAFFADDSVKHWDPSFVDLIDGRFYHFIHDCISNRECDSKTSETLQELRSSDLYKTLSKAYGGQIIHYNNKGDKLSAKSAGESDSDDNVDSTSSSSDESESSDSDCDEDFALIFPRSMKTTFRLKKKEGSEHALQSSAFDTALGLLQAPLLSAQPTVESSLLPNPDLWPSHELQSASYGSASDDQAAAARLRARGDEWASKKKIAVSVNTSFGDALSEALYAPHSFQRMAFQHIEKGHCTLVLAPTGSGKTDIAICTAYQVLQQNAASITTKRSRVVVVVPTKALANQTFSTIWAKMRLNENSLGISTGAYTCNADAAVVVTIAQSLLQRLYQGTFDYTHVVLDEFHSILKPDDGYIWENIVNLIPSGVQIVGLTATLRNKMEVLGWLQSVHPNFRLVEMKGSRPVKQDICIFSRGEMSRVPQFCILNSNHGGIDRTEHAVEWERASLVAIERAGAYDNAISSSNLFRDCPFTMADLYEIQTRTLDRSNKIELLSLVDLRREATLHARSLQANASEMRSTSPSILLIKDSAMLLFDTNLDCFAVLGDSVFQLIIDLMHISVQNPCEKDKILLPLLLKLICLCLPLCSDALALFRFYRDFLEATVFNLGICDFSYQIMSLAARNIQSEFYGNCNSDKSYLPIFFMAHCGLLRWNRLLSSLEPRKNQLEELLTNIRDESENLDSRCLKAHHWYLQSCFTPIIACSVIHETEVAQFLLHNANEDININCGVCIFGRVLLTGYQMWPLCHKLLSGVSQHLSLPSIACFVDIICFQTVLRDIDSVRTTGNNLLQHQRLDGRLTGVQKSARRRMGTISQLFDLDSNEKRLSEWSIKSAQIALTISHRIRTIRSLVAPESKDYRLSIVLEIKVLGAVQIFFEAEKRFMNISVSEVDYKIVSIIDQSRLYRSLSNNAVLDLLMAEDRRTVVLVDLLSMLHTSFFHTSVQRDIYTHRAVQVLDLYRDLARAFDVNPFLKHTLTSASEEYLDSVSKKSTGKFLGCTLVHAKSLFFLTGLFKSEATDEDYTTLCGISHPVSYFCCSMGLPFNNRFIEFIESKESQHAIINDSTGALMHSFALRLASHYKTGWLLTQRILPSVEVFWTQYNLNMLLSALIEIYDLSTAISRSAPHAIGLLIKAGIQGDGVSRSSVRSKFMREELRLALSDVGESVLMRAIGHLGHEKSLYKEIMMSPITYNCWQLYNYLLLWNQSFKGLSELREQLHTSGSELGTPAWCVLSVLCRIALQHCAVNHHGSRSPEEGTAMQRHEAGTVSFLLLEAFGGVVGDNNLDPHIQELAQKLHSFMCFIGWERNIRIKLILTFQLLVDQPVLIFTSDNIMPCSHKLAASRHDLIAPSDDIFFGPVDSTEEGNLRVWERDAVLIAQPIVAAAINVDEEESWENFANIPQFQNISVSVKVQEKIPPLPALAREISVQTEASEESNKDVNNGPLLVNGLEIAYMKWCYGLMLKQAQRAFAVPPVRDDTCHALCKYMEKNGMLPAIVFTFERRTASDAAFKLADMFDTMLLSCEELVTVDLLIRDTGSKHLDVNILRLIRRGIGIHHSDVSDLDRAFVEKLLNLGLVKIVFCTSSLAEGVHMPCTTVCLYQDVSAYIDEKMFRQCIGRAGRQGGGVIQGNVVISGNYSAERIFNFLKGVNLTDFVDGQSRVFPLTAIYPSSRFELEVAKHNNVLGVEKTLNRRALCAFEPGTAVAMNSIKDVTKRIIDIAGIKSVRMAVRLVHIDLQLRLCFVYLLRRYVGRFVLSDRLRLKKNWKNYRANKDSALDLVNELTDIASDILALICSCCANWDGAKATSYEDVSFQPLLPKLSQNVIDDSVAWNKEILQCVLRYGRRYKLSSPTSEKPLPDHRIQRQIGPEWRRRSASSRPIEESDPLEDPFLVERIQLESSRPSERVAPEYDGLSGHGYGYISCGLVSSKLFDISDIPFESLPLVDLDNEMVRRKHGYLQKVVFGWRSDDEIKKIVDVTQSKWLIPSYRLRSTLKDLRRTIGTLLQFTVIEAGQPRSEVTKNDVMRECLYLMRNRIGKVSGYIAGDVEDNEAAACLEDAIEDFWA